MLLACRDARPHLGVATSECARKASVRIGSVTYHHDSAEILHPRLGPHKPRHRRVRLARHDRANSCGSRDAAENCAAPGDRSVRSRVGGIVIGSDQPRARAHCICCDAHHVVIEAAMEANHHCVVRCPRCHDGTTSLQCFVDARPAANHHPIPDAHEKRCGQR